MDKDKLFELEVVCPDRKFYQGKASMIEFTTSEGDIGVYKGHIPLTAVIEPSVLTIHEDEGKKYAAIHGGFVEILPDKITMLAEAAEWPDEIDLKRAEEAKGRAEKLLSRQNEMDINTARAEASLKRALTRIDAKK